MKFIAHLSRKLKGKQKGTQNSIFFYYLISIDFIFQNSIYDLTFVAKAKENIVCTF
jgi:hypothetical protein